MAFRTNRFLMKRRNKEFGIYLTLGMSKQKMSLIIKEETISTKDRTVDEKKEPAEKSNAPVQATNKVIQTADISSIQAAYKTKKFIKERRNDKAAHVNSTNKVRSTNESKASKYSSATKQTSKTDYRGQMKSHFIFKHRMKAKETMVNPPAAKTTNKVANIFNKTLNIIKRSIFTVNHMISYGTALILLIVITLYIGVFSAFTDNSVYADSFIPLSEEVIAYTPIIEEYTAQYGIEEFVPLVQAIMMQESKGLGNDPMDSSHFEYNTKYPEGITEPEYSIKVGVHYLSDCLNNASVSSPADTELIYLAIQGYDFGKEYINWAMTNFGGYSKSNAQIYFEQFLSDGDVNYVNHVMQYIGFSFGTFRLEPNFDNHLAWGNNNPYSRNKLYGQCTWFAWGRFYELYGYSPGFTGDGWNCAKQLVNAHPDLFELSSSP